MPTVIFVHGNQITTGDAKSEGLTVYRRMMDYGGDADPIRFVIFSWPSSKVGRLLQDVRVKAVRTGPAGCQLAWLLDQMPAETPGLAGRFQLRCADHHRRPAHSRRRQAERLARAGRARESRSPADERRADRAALHAHWLGKGQYHGLAMTQVSQMLLVNNCQDLAMRYYHFLTPAAAARRHSACAARPASAPNMPPRFTRATSAATSGREHDLFRYLCVPGAVGQIWDYTRPRKPSQPRSPNSACRTPASAVSQPSGIAVRREVRLGSADPLTSCILRPLYTGPMETPWAYLNGAGFPRPSSRIAVDDVGFLQGATVTERLRTFRGEVFRLDEHLRRLRHSLEIVGLAVDDITAQIAQAVPEFVERNQPQLSPGRRLVDRRVRDAGRFRRGPANRVRPRISAAVSALGLALRSGRDGRHQRHPADPPAVLAARAEVPQPDALLSGRRRAAAAQPGARAICSMRTATSPKPPPPTCCVYREGEGLVSPPHEHILFGVSLGVVKELAAKLDVPFVTRPLTVEEFRSADEAMLTSTSVCLLPIVQCDGQPIGDGQPGPIYRRLLAAWSELVGVDIAEQARRYSSRRAL